jgi:hypothetical protein
VLALSVLSERVFFLKNFILLFSIQTNQKMKTKFLGVVLIAFWVSGCSSNDPAPATFDPSGVYQGAEIETGGKRYSLNTGTVSFEVAKLGDNQIRIKQTGEIYNATWPNVSGTYKVQADVNGKTYRGTDSGVMIQPDQFSFRQGSVEILATK